MLKTAIFINDYLLLIDFLSKVEGEFPLLEYTIFGDKEFAASFSVAWDSTNAFLKSNHELNIGNINI